MRWSRKQIFEMLLKAQLFSISIFFLALLLFLNIILCRFSPTGWDLRRFLAQHIFLHSLVPPFRERRN